MKVLVLSSLAYSLVNFRGALLRQMVSHGHDVVACAPDEDKVSIGQLADMGVSFRRIPMDRTGTNPLRDAITFWAMIRAIRSEAPDVILAYTQKPIIYGGIAARMAGHQQRFFAMVSGLGQVYSQSGNGPLKLRLLRRLISRMYRSAVARAEAIFVFNADDAVEMRRQGIVGRAQTIIQVPGSGVDVKKFAQQPLADGPPTFLLIARLMRAKGIAEFVEAAAILRRQDLRLRFRILGPREPGAAGFTREEVNSWRDKGVEYLGTTRDVRPHLAAASVFVLPTYYREGLPRTILEAMATGRAIITTDSSGCRETVVEGENGLLVPPRDIRALATAMGQLAGEPELIRRMGARSRLLAEQRFRVEAVNRLLITTMALDGRQPSPLPSSRADGIGYGERGLAALLLILTLPLMALIAASVALAIGRPVLFLQRRAGRARRDFKLIKFRSMRDVRDDSGQLLPDQARLTRFGRLLRRSRLDELPELWNILRGEMSFVGPRPLLPETVDAMGPAGVRRGIVRPGLTGWAQVNGNALLSDADKLALDLWYIDNRSLACDLEIILRTFATVLCGERVSRPNIRRACAGTVDRRG